MLSCVSVCVCVFMHMCVSMYHSCVRKPNMRVRVCVCVCVCLCVCVCVCLCVCVCVCSHVHLVCTCMCPCFLQEVTHYLVKWCSLSYEEATWELKEDVDPVKIREFEELKKLPDMKYVVGDISNDFDF